MRLRGFTAAAELKLLGLPNGTVHSIFPSPRLHRRGRIEAATLARRRFSCGRSPRLHRRGRIEALAMPQRVILRDASPRLHRRGRIEAELAKVGTQAKVKGLRGFTAAAELKLSWRRRHEMVSGWSPRLHRRGRIEARPSRGLPAIRHRSLRGFTAAAELKLLSLAENVSSCPRVSAASPPRPN